MPILTEDRSYNSKALKPKFLNVLSGKSAKYEKERREAHLRRRLKSPKFFKASPSSSNDQQPSSSSQLASPPLTNPGK